MAKNNKENMDEFKKVLRDNIFAATTTGELSVERIFEIADEISEFVLKAARKHLIGEVCDDKIFNRDYIITISADYNDSAFWGLTRKGEKVAANKKEMEMISSVIGEMKLKIDNFLKNDE